jgi:hypothetical protein
MIIKQYPLLYTDVYPSDFSDMPFSLMATVSDVYILHNIDSIYPYKTFRNFYKYIKVVYKILEPM